MDSGTIFYIIAIILYFIYTAFVRKKTENLPGSEMEHEHEKDHPPRKDSFEDLLREIRNEQQERERDIVISGEPKSKDLSEEPEMEEEWVKPPSPKSIQYKNVDEAFRDKFSKQPLVKLDDKVEIDEDEKILGEVEDVAGTHTRINRYALLLKNKDSFKNAFITSEILNRKHF